MYVVHTETLFSGTATSTGNTQSSPVVSKYSEEAIFFLDITAVSGTNPTLDLTIHVYDEIGGNWHLLATFSQNTATGTDVGYVQYGIGSKLSITHTIGGTNTPSFAFTVSVLLKDV